MKHKGTKNLAILLALALLFALVPGLSGTAYADSGSDYTFSIPSSLTVQNVGENAAGNISVTALTSGKKLTVSAASTNGWELKSGDNSVGYSMSKTSWEFTAAGSEAFSITVNDYSTKPAGTYQDTVTFTAKVENAGPTLADALKDGGKIKFEYQYNGRYSTYFEFTNNNGSYTLSPLKEEFNTTNLRVKADNPNVLILDVVCVLGNRRMDSFCSTIEFDTTDNTFKFTNRGATPTNPPRKCELISVSVNGTDVTNKLTDISQDNS